MNAASLARFAALAARSRAELWGCVVTLSTDTRATKQQLPVSKSPEQQTRMADEQRAGYIERTTCTFLFPGAWFNPAAGGCLTSAAGYAADFTPLALGTEITVTADATNPHNVGTIWRVFDLTSSFGGSERRAVAFRLDS